MVVLLDTNTKALKASLMFAVFDSPDMVCADILSSRSLSFLSCLRVDGAFNFLFCSHCELHDSVPHYLSICNNIPKAVRGTTPAHTHMSLSIQKSLVLLGLYYIFASNIFT